MQGLKHCLRSGGQACKVLHMCKQGNGLVPIVVLVNLATTHAHVPGASARLMINWAMYADWPSHFDMTMFATSVKPKHAPVTSSTPASPAAQLRSANRATSSQPAACQLSTQRLLIILLQII